jgi:hypothetical protein
MKARSFVMCVVLLGVFSGCSSTGNSAVAGPNLYRDPGGWQVLVPAGWRAQPFSFDGRISSAEGAQISDVASLPPPRPLTGVPLQASSNDVPSPGIAVVIATDDGHRNQRGKRIQTPPLTIDEMEEGSGIGSVLDLMWFRGDGHTFVLTARISDGSYGHPYDALRALIGSIRFG